MKSLCIPQDFNAVLTGLISKPTKYCTVASSYIGWESIKIEKRLDDSIRATQCIQCPFEIELYFWSVILSWQIKWSLWSSSHLIFYVLSIMQSVATRLFKAKMCNKTLLVTQNSIRSQIFFKFSSYFWWIKAKPKFLTFSKLHEVWF